MQLPDICAICGTREDLTKHHIQWPRKLWKSHPLWSKLITILCEECHDMVHNYYGYTRYEE